MQKAKGNKKKNAKKANVKVRDLAPKAPKTGIVTGGRPCATGEHIKEVSLTP
ncbi:MAG TPA: hypothetical protein VID04_00850 [Methylomirabilota bacterium]|jgi:hypothetical protein